MYPTRRLYQQWRTTVRTTMDERGMTRTKLAARAGVSPQMITNLLRACGGYKQGTPSIDTLNNVGRRLRIWIKGDQLVVS